MPEKRLKELLKKYLEGKATAEDEKRINEWYESLSATDRESLSDAERGRLRTAYWSAIQADIHTQAAKHRNIWPRVMAIAASVSVVLMVMFYTMWPGTVEKVARSVSTETLITPFENNTNEIMIAILPDSSRVSLLPNSRISYREDFGKSDRKVTLAGEAFFEIIRDTERPFYVFTSEVVTRVLGTSFRVIAYPDADAITVAVSTGKVSVYAMTDEALPVSDGDEIILTPNQQAVYTISDQAMLRSIVKEPRAVIPGGESAVVRFEGAPVSEVFGAIEKMYQVQIQFDREVFDGCSITTTVTGKDMFERIDVICEVIGASYEVTGTTILISGSGCD